MEREDQRDEPITPPEGFEPVPRGEGFAPREPEAASVEPPAKQPQLPGALRFAGGLTLVLYGAGAIVAAAALDDAGASGLAVAGVFLAALLPGAVLASLLFGVAGWLATRGCPRCGSRVPLYDLDCEACGFDFRTIGR